MAPQYDWDSPEAKNDYFGRGRDPNLFPMGSAAWTTAYTHQQYKLAMERLRQQTQEQENAKRKQREQENAKRKQREQEDARRKQKQSTASDYTGSSGTTDWKELGEMALGAAGLAAMGAAAYAAFMLRDEIFMVSSGALLNAFAYESHLAQKSPAVKYGSFLLSVAGISGAVTALVKHTEPGGIIDKAIVTAMTHPADTIATTAAVSAALFYKPVLKAVEGVMSIPSFFKQQKPTTAQRAQRHKRAGIATAALVAGSLLLAPQADRILQGTKLENFLVDVVDLSPPAAETADPNAQYMSVTAKQLNLRSCPSASCDVVAIMPQGSVGKVTGPAQKGWQPLSAEGVDSAKRPVTFTGYANNAYLAPARAPGS